MVATQTAKFAQKFSETFPELLSHKAGSDLALGLRLAADFKSRKPEDYIERIQRGDPTFIPSGHEGHAVSVLIWNDLLVIGNRGSERGAQTIKIGRYGPTKLNSNFIQKLLALRSKDDSNYHQAMNNDEGKSPLLEEIGFETGDNETTLESLAALPVQKVGNCAWANQEATVKAYFLLTKIQERGFKLPENPEELTLVKTSMEETFQTWLLSQKMTFIEKNIISGSNPEAIIENVFEILRKDLSKVPPKVREVLEEKIKEMEQRHIAQATSETMGQPVSPLR